MFIDTHAHLNYPDIVKNIEEISLSVQEMEQQIVNHSNIKEQLDRTRELVLKILDE